MKRNKPNPEPPVSQIETFRDPRGYWLNDLARHNEPSCINGCVAIRRYLVTAVEIEEPKQVLLDRLIKLVRDCDNYHHWEPLYQAAQELGLKWDAEKFGKNVKRERRQ